MTFFLREGVISGIPKDEIQPLTARGDCAKFSEYDLEAVAELVRKGYVLKEPQTYTVSMPLFTLSQYSAACRIVRNFVTDKLEKIIHEINLTFVRIIGEHTPRHLQDQVSGVARTGRIINTACIPLRILIDRKVLNPDWNPMEMAAMQIQLNRNDVIVKNISIYVLAIILLIS